MDKRGFFTGFAEPVCGLSYLCLFSANSMSKPTFINSKVVYHDNSTEFNIDARGKDLASVIRACQTEDITPLSSSGAPDFSSEIPDSIIFTKKAHQEHKIPTIRQSPTKIHHRQKRQNPRTCARTAILAKRRIRRCSL